MVKGFKVIYTIVFKKHTTFSGQAGMAPAYHPKPLDYHRKSRGVVQQMPCCLPEVKQKELNDN
jgi:hypothetical protein